MSETANLHDMLIEAGMALLQEGGIQGLTLRRAAARAGVSHAAPAHHFAGLNGLLTAIAGRAHTQFGQAMVARRNAAPADALARLQAICQGYLDFAATHAGLFHLMFASTKVDRTAAEVTGPSAQAYQILREACLPFAAGPGPDPDFEIAVWSLVHGYAALGFVGPDCRAGAAGVAPPFARCLQVLVGQRRALPLAPDRQMG